MDKRNIFSVLNISIDVDRYNMLLALLAGIAILFALTPGTYFVMTLHDFLPLHTSQEFSPVLIAFMIFGMSWRNVSPIRSAGITF